MSGVNSKCSRGDLALQCLKPLIPDELLTDVFGYLAADSNLEELLNLRLVCSLWKREAFRTLKTKRALLPWIVVNGDSDHLKLVQDSLSRTEKGNHTALKSLGSCLDNVTPGCGLPLQLVVNTWTSELGSFTREFSSDIVNVWICGEKFEGFPADLGGIEFPALEQTPFSAFEVRNIERECDGFIKALAFWKELVKFCRNPKMSEVNVGISRFNECLVPQRRLSPDHEVFRLLEWSRVTSLQCSYEFYQEASASKDFSALQKLKCWNIYGREFGGQLSLEKVAHLEEMEFACQLSLQNMAHVEEFRSSIEWRLDHPMKNLKTLKLSDTTIVCGQSPSNFLPSLKKIVVDVENEFSSFAFPDEGTVYSLISGGGEYQVVSLSLRECWTNFRQVGLDDLPVQLTDRFPKLTEFEWDSYSWGIMDAAFIANRNVLIAAPVIFSRLEFLTKLKLTVAFTHERYMVELVSGIPFAEVPQEEDSWPTLLDGNPHSISNLKHLQTFAFNQRDCLWTSRRPRVSMRYTRFLFMAAFRRMANLKELYFKNIKFEDTSSFTEWQETGRTIEIKLEDDEVTMDSESSGDE